MNNTESRSRIMARVRAASAGHDATAVEQALSALGVAPAAPAPHDDVTTAFMANVLKNQGTLAIAADRGEAVKQIAMYVYQHYKSHRLVGGNDPRLAAMPWRDAGVLPRFGEIENGEQVALSYAQWGIAETGATVFVTGKHNPSRNNLLPERHIVLIDADQILADLESLWRQLGALMETNGRPRGVNCIAGPSSTADIEGQLVYGAHGPRAWHVIVLGSVTEGQLETAQALHTGSAAPGASSH